MKKALLRRITQILGVILPNSYFIGWTGNPQIYQGKLKAVVAPLLNCYACPSAAVSCPVGSAQHFFALKTIPYFVIGVVGAVGLFLGRATCGWLCPFGFLQDLEFKLGRIIKLPHIKLPGWIGYGKFLFLIALVILAPILTVRPMFDDETGEVFTYIDTETGKVEKLFEPGLTTFCKICPQGALQGGIPQVLLHPELRAIVGKPFTAKMVILGVCLIAFLMMKRPFCRAVCPLGAFLGLFNYVSLLRFEVDIGKCTNCRLCEYNCPVEHNIYKSPNSHNCIRCGECFSACKFGAIKVSNIFIGSKKTAENKSV